jgi:hypothetical protein
MILVYNETENPIWELREKNNNYLQVINKQTSECSISILRKDVVDDELKKESLDSINDLNNLKVFYSGNTAVRFDRWQLRPFIRKAGNDFNTNVVLASIDISDGRRLLNIRNYNAYIYSYYYNYEKKQLFIIFSMNESISKACLELLFENEEGQPDNPRVFLKVFHLSYGSHELKITSRNRRKNDIPPIGNPGYIAYSDHTVDKYNYYQRNYLPMRLTQLMIFLKRGQKDYFLTDELIKKNRVHPNQMIIIEPPEEGEFNLRNTIRDLIETKRITAVTYIDPEKQIEDARVDKETYQAFKKNILVDNYGDYFTHVFFMDGEQKICLLK